MGAMTLVSTIMELTKALQTYYKELDLVSMVQIAHRQVATDPEYVYERYERGSGEINIQTITANDRYTQLMQPFLNKLYNLLSSLVTKDMAHVIKSFKHLFFVVV